MKSQSDDYCFTTRGLQKPLLHSFQFWDNTSKTLQGQSKSGSCDVDNREKRHPSIPVRLNVSERPRGQETFVRVYGSPHKDVCEGQGVLTTVGRTLKQGYLESHSVHVQNSFSTTYTNKKLRGGLDQLLLKGVKCSIDCASIDAI